MSRSGRVVAVLAAEMQVQRLLLSLGEDPTRDGLKDTPARVVRALQEMTSGYRQDPKEILGRVFKDEHDELVTLDHIEFYSLCEHHLQVFSGHVHIGYIPGKRGIVGISKLARLVDCFARRLQVQERLTRQIAEAINTNLKPRGVGVVIEAQHLCCRARGIRKQSSVMRTSVMTGMLRQSHAARAEFLQLVLREGAR
jgi:GTP cyclohydrolase I